MRILTRYVLKEYLVPLFYCMSGFISIYVMFELFGSFSRLIESELGTWTVVEYFLAYLAPFFMYLAPAALMLAALYTMWRFCRNSEIIAMRASGVGFFTIVKPIIAVSIVMAGFVAWINEYYVPEKAQWAKQLRNERFSVEGSDSSGLEKIIYSNSAENRTWKIGSMTILNGCQLDNVSVLVKRPDGSPKYIVNAPKAKYMDNEWWFFNPEVEYLDSHGLPRPSQTPELEKLSLRVFPEFSETPRDLRMQNLEWQYCSVRDKLTYLKTQTSLKSDVKRQYTYDIYAQILSPFACIIITLFAIPSGIASGRQSVFKGILGAIGAFFAFWAMNIGSLVLARTTPIAPLICATVPYGVFLYLGLYTFHKHR